MTNKTLFTTNHYPIQLKLFNNLFDDVFTDFKPFEKSWDFNPKADIIENTDTFGISLEIPGLTMEEVEVTLENGVLEITGEKNKVSSDNDDVKTHRTERMFGKFKRSFQIPETIDSENIQATMKDGVLLLSLPKLKESEIDSRRRIEIKAA